MKPLAGLRVLIVDDDEDSRELIGFVLNARGAEVMRAGDGEAALKALEAHRPHVLLSDLSMPGEDGYQFLARVRALPEDRGGRTTAVALSAHAGDADRLRSLQAGFQHHVSKPVDPNLLVSLLAPLVPTPTGA